MFSEFQRVWAKLVQVLTRSPRTPPEPGGDASSSQQKKKETWTEKQIIRLVVEKKVLDRRMSQFQWFEPRDPTKTNVTGWVKTSDGSKYQLKVLLGPKFPDQMPHMFVTYPHTLRKFRWGTINRVGLSHAFHTHGRGPGGCVEICHCHNSSWNASRTIASVLIKGVIWCEAHRRHLKTGKSIASLCDELRNQAPGVFNNDQL